MSIRIVCCAILYLCTQIPIGERRLERISLTMDRSLRNTHLMKYKIPSKDELRVRLAALPAQAAELLSSRKFWHELVLMTVAMFIGAMAVHLSLIHI